MFQLNHIPAAAKKSDYSIILNIVKAFKYDLIKILIFLFIFAFSLLFVLTEKDKYYIKDNPHTVSSQFHD